uniref:Uncharacterized protein n=1 Tax=viral metagenome TaxID=1070528 RepID=A0A6C0KLH2_9ZZZZ
MKKYEGYCLSCFVHMYPDRPNARNYKTKERAVVESVLRTFPHFTWIDDKRVQDGCSARRPDLLLDLGYQVIIVEIDENQHRSYDCSCENKRLMQLSQDVEHRPIVFIRFNPDGYRTSMGPIPSCWGYDGRGMCMIKRSKEEEWVERLKVLHDTIHYWTQESNCTDKTVEVFHLFYDEPSCLDDSDDSYDSSEEEEAEAEEEAESDEAEEESKESE